MNRNKDYISSSINDECIVYLTIEGTEYQGLEINITNVYRSVNDTIQRIVDVFQLPIVDADGNPVEYFLERSFGDSNEILYSMDDKGNELLLADYCVLQGGWLYLKTMKDIAPKESGDPLQASEIISDDHEFLIRLTIEGTEYEEEEVYVSEPSKTIRDIIASIVKVFNLPKMDGGNTPIQYQLGRINEEGEAETLFPEDEEGLELNLLDYDIQSGDLLQLVAVPVAGYGCSIPSELQNAVLRKAIIEFVEKSKIKIKRQYDA